MLKCCMRLFLGVIQPEKLDAGELNALTADIWLLCFFKCSIPTLRVYFIFSDNIISPFLFGEAHDIFKAAVIIHSQKWEVLQPWEMPYVTACAPSSVFIGMAACCFCISTFHPILLLFWNGKLWFTDISPHFTPSQGSYAVELSVFTWFCLGKSDMVSVIYLLLGNQSRSLNEDRWAMKLMLLVLL